jgi:hypothetical protein
MTNHPSNTKVFNPAPGWYRGDFHAHTTASDGHYSPPDFARLALEQGLDFIAVTDHNSIAAFNQFGENPGLMIFPGVEITLKEGHWNVFGMPGWQDWMEGICINEIRVTLSGKFHTPSQVMHQTASLGLLNSINHPLLKPWEWRDGLTELRYVDCLEIWNDPLWPDNAQANPQAVEMWTKWLNAGYRITAIGGSDFHFLPGELSRYPGEIPGLPSTYVYASQLSNAAIIAGLKARRVYVSMGPQVSFRAETQGKTYHIGDDIGQVNGEIQFKVTVTGADPNSTARLNSNGQNLFEVLIGEGTSQISFSHQPDPFIPQWYRLEVLDPEGQVIAITNPIFTGPPVESPQEKFEDFLE